MEAMTPRLHTLCKRTEWFWVVFNVTEWNGLLGPPEQNQLLGHSVVEPGTTSHALENR